VQRELAVLTGTDLLCAGVIRLGCRPLICSRHETLIALQATEVHDILGTFRRQCGVKGMSLQHSQQLMVEVLFVFMMGVPPSSKKT
jgi:hypothetical protein